MMAENYLTMHPHTAVTDLLSAHVEEMWTADEFCVGATVMEMVIHVVDDLSMYDIALHSGDG